LFSIDRPVRSYSASIIFGSTDDSPSTPPSEGAGESPSDAAERDLRRYKNRAALLERTLRDKMSELRRARNRAAVLRDVASRLKSANTNVTSRMEEEIESASTAAAASARVEAEERLGTEIASLKSELDEAREGRVQARVRYDALVDRMEEREMEWGAERDRARREMDEAERKLKGDFRTMRRGRDEAEQAREELDEALAEAREVVRGLEEQSGRSEEEREKLAQSLEEREEEIRALSQEERAKRQRLKEELASARAAQHEAEGALAAKIASVETKDDGEEQNDQRKQQEEESAAIAAGAVRAAEERESDALSRLDKVSAELREALRNKDDADVLLRGASKERAAALERLKALRDARDGREDRLKERLGRAEEDAWRLDAEMELLAKERDGARDKLMDERLRHGGKMREEQARYDRAMLEEREGHEAQVRELRDRLDSVEREARRSGVVVVSDKSVASRPSRITRVWQRIRSPRSWFGSRKSQ